MWNNDKMRLVAGVFCEQGWFGAISEPFCGLGWPQLCWHGLPHQRAGPWQWEWWWFLKLEVGHWNIYQSVAVRSRHVGDHPCRGLGGVQAISLARSQPGLVIFLLKSIFTQISKWQFELRCSPQGTDGWVSPPEDLLVRGKIHLDNKYMFIDINNDNVVDWQGWAYNVWNITNSEAAVYTFQLDGERTLLKFWSKFNFFWT